MDINEKERDSDKEKIRMARERERWIKRGDKVNEG